MGGMTNMTIIDQETTRQLIMVVYTTYRIWSSCFLSEAKIYVKKKENL